MKKQPANFFALVYLPYGLAIMWILMSFSMVILDHGPLSGAFTITALTSSFVGNTGRECLRLIQANEERIGQLEQQLAGEPAPADVACTEA